jgi:DNA-binding transcriptional ArsR family regulator
MQHLKVLEDSGLVVVRRSGRSRINHLNPVPIQQIYERWVSHYEGRWTEALLSLKRQVERSRETHLPDSHSSTAS